MIQVSGLQQPRDPLQRRLAAMARDVILRDVLPRLGRLVSVPRQAAAGAARADIAAS